MTILYGLVDVRGSIVLKIMDFCGLGGRGPRTSMKLPGSHGRHGERAMQSSMPLFIA